MEYVKCPRCKLNYIVDGEEFCDVCQAEIGYKKSNCQKVVEPIYDYVCRVYSDFQNYLNSCDTLCDLKSITFEINCLPDYSNVHVQQLYLLRYVYAYAYEYKFMYTNLFNNNFDSSDISVMSIGCGNMIDYWALVQVLIEHGKSNCVINYTGIDIIDWQYKVNIRAKDTVIFKQQDAIKYLKEQSHLDSDIYFFPKSISEFSDSTFNELCDCFKRTPILKDKFCVLISIRPVKKWKRRDIDRNNKLINSLRQNGFVTTDNPNTYYSHKKAEEYIRDLDDKFVYPTWIIDQMNNLTGQCVSEKANQQNCVGCDKINRSPMLTANYVQYQIFTFYREQ